MISASDAEGPDRWAGAAWAVSLAGCLVLFLNVLATWRVFHCAFVMRATREWEQGEKLYGDLLNYPFVQAAYGWLNYALLRLLRFFADAETAGRLFTVLGIVLLLAALAAAAYKLTGSLLLTVATVGAMAAIPLVTETRQPDRLAAVFEVLAVAVFASGAGAASAVVAGLLGGSATLGKASAVGALAGFALAGLILPGRRRAVIACGAGGGMLLLLTAILQWWSGGNYLRGLLYVGADDAKSAWAAYDHLLPVVKMMAPAAPVLALVLLLNGHRSRPARIAACALLCCATVALVGATKVGAGPGYFLTSICLTSLILAAALADLPRALQTRAVVALGLAVLAAAVPTRATLSTWKHGLRFETEPVYAEARTLLEQLPAGPLWSEEPRLACLTGRPVIGDDPHSLRRAVETGRMSITPVLEALRQRRAAVLVLNEKPFPQMQSLLFHVHLDAASRQFSCAAWANYEIRGRAEGLLFLTPRAVRLDEATCKAEDLPWWSGAPITIEEPKGSCE